MKAGMAKRRRDWKKINEILGVMRLPESPKEFSLVERSCVVS